MCGRFTMRTPSSEIAKAFNLAGEPEIEARYNIAPTQTITTIREAQDGRELQSLKWGFVPGWAKDASMGTRLINARSETVAEKPAFREAFRRRRCLIPADGFYEWQRVGNRKQPIYFQMSDGRPFAFAGLWEHWEGADGEEEINSCTILTTQANELLAPVHERMPVILAPKDYDLWLDASVTKTDKIMPLLRPYRSDEMSSHRVGLDVNNPRHDEARLIEPFPNSE